MMVRLNFRISQKAQYSNRAVLTKTDKSKSPETCGEEEDEDDGGAPPGQEADNYTHQTSQVKSSQGSKIYSN